MKQHHFQGKIPCSKYPFTIFARDSSKKMYRRPVTRSVMTLLLSSVCSITPPTYVHSLISRGRLSGIPGHRHEQGKDGAKLCPRESAVQGRRTCKRGQSHWETVCRLKVTEKKMPALHLPWGKGSGRRLSVEFYSLR